MSERIEIEYEGKTRRGSYVIEKGMLIVTYTDLWGEVATVLGSAAPDSLARIMLRELVEQRIRENAV